MGFLIPGSQVRTLQGVQLKWKSMKYTNYRGIDKIEFKYPALMAKDAETKVRKLFEQIQLTKDLLGDAVIVAEELRTRLDELEKEWETMSNLIKVSYKEEEKEEVKGDIHLGFNFGTDINKHIH